MTVAFIIFTTFAACTMQTTKENKDEASLGDYKAEITFDSVIHYLSDTSSSQGQVCLIASCRNLTGDTLRMKFDKRYSGGRNISITARYDTLSIPVRLCTKNSIFLLLPHEILPNEEINAGYEFSVTFFLDKLYNEEEYHELFIYSEKFYDEFFRGCTFHLEDSTLSVKLIKSPNFKVVNGKRTNLGYMPCNAI